MVARLMESHALCKSSGRATQSLGVPPYEASWLTDCTSVLRLMCQT